MSRAQLMASVIAAMALGGYDGLLRDRGRQATEPRQMTDADKAKIAKAEAKRQRRAEKRLSQVKETTS